MMRVDPVTQTVVLASALIYVLLLFAIASYGDRGGQRGGNSRPACHTSTLSVSLSIVHRGRFLGPVGLASERGLEYHRDLHWPNFGILRLVTDFCVAIIRLAKTERITSIADMLAARYGKSFRCCFAGNMHCGTGSPFPSIAGLFQLKAISGCLTCSLATLAARSWRASLSSLIFLFWSLHLLEFRRFVRNPPC